MYTRLVKSGCVWKTGVGWKHFLSSKEQNPPYTIVQVSLLEPVNFQVSLRHFLTLKFALLEAMTLNLLLRISLVPGWIYFTEEPEPASEIFDTVTNSATTLKWTQVDASSTGSHDSRPSTLASSDDESVTLFHNFLLTAVTSLQLLREK